MDTVNMKSFISFRYDKIDWSSYRPAIMGIQAFLSGYYFNYPSNTFQLANVIGHGTSNNKLLYGTCIINLYNFFLFESACKSINIPFAKVLALIILIIIIKALVEKLIIIII